MDVAYKTKEGWGIVVGDTGLSDPTISLVGDKVTVYEYPISLIIPVHPA